MHQQSRVWAGAGCWRGNSSWDTDLDKGAVRRQRIEIEVEDGLADDVQRELGEAGLHVHSFP